MKVWFNSLCLFWFVLSASTSCGFLSCSLTKFLSFTAGLWSVFGAFTCEEGNSCQHLNTNCCCRSWPSHSFISSLMTDPAYINPLDLPQGLDSKLAAQQIWGEVQHKTSCIRAPRESEVCDCRYLGVSTAALFRRGVYAVCNVHNERNLTIQKAWWRNSKIHHIFIFGFLCLIMGMEVWLKICTPCFVYRQIRLNLLRDDCHFSIIFLWMIII
jgi:hypothetical protein